MSKSIEIIDIQALFGNDLEKKIKVAKQIENSCKQTGFFGISNHGIEELERLGEYTFNFFKHLSKEQKFELKSFTWNKNNTNTYRGYFPSVIGKEGFVNFCKFHYFLNSLI